MLNPLRVQSCWPVTTMRTSTCLTPTTATGPTISGDTRDIATTPQVFGPAHHFIHSLWEDFVEHGLNHPSSPASSCLSEGGELLWAVQRVCGQRQRLWTHLPVGQILCPHRTVHGGRQRRSGEAEGTKFTQRNDNGANGSWLASWFPCL